MYAPRESREADGYFALSSTGRPCLVRTRATGPSERSAAFHASAVSVASAGLMTVRRGTDLRPANCSIGWWVGPSSPRPMESCVNT